MGAADSKPHWQPDDKVACCGGCQAPFSLTKRRHHCRSCGWIFCVDCSKWKAFDPDHMASGTTDRVCRSCHDALASSPSNRAAGTAAAGADGGGTNGPVTSAGALGEATAVSRRPIVIQTSDPEPAVGGHSPPVDADSDENGGAMYETALHRANGMFVDARQWGVRRSDGLRMTDRNIEQDLKAVGGTVHIQLTADVDPEPRWGPFALPSVDATALFAAQHELSPSIFDLHQAAVEGLPASSGGAPRGQPLAATTGSETVLST